MDPLAPREDRSRSFEFLEDTKPDILRDRELALYLTCAWGATLIGNFLCMYPAVFAYTIQQHLGVSENVIGLFLSVPALLAFVMYLLGPAIVETFGVELVFPCASVLVFASMSLVWLGYHLKSVFILLPALCMLRPLLGLCDITKLSLLGCSVDRETYASLTGIGTAVVTAGYSLAHYTMPHLPRASVLPFMLVLTVVAGAMNQYTAHVGAGRLPSANNRTKTDRGVTLRTELARSWSMDRARDFPWKYWLVAFAGAFKASFMAFTDFQPYAFQRCNGLGEKQSNAITGCVSLCTIAFSPLAGHLFSRYKSLHGPLFIMAAILLLVARLVAALEFSLVLAWSEMIVTGMAQAFMSAGSMGLMPEVLLGREDLLVSGNSFAAFSGQVFCLITTQVCFAIFRGSQKFEQKVENLELEWTVTPGQFFMVGQACVLLVIAIAINRAAPLAPSQAVYSKEMLPLKERSDFATELQLELHAVTCTASDASTATDADLASRTISKSPSN